MRAGGAGREEVKVKGMRPSTMGGIGNTRSGVPRRITHFFHVSEMLFIF